MGLPSHQLGRPSPRGFANPPACTTCAWKPSPEITLEPCVKSWAQVMLTDGTHAHFTSIFKMPGPGPPGFSCSLSPAAVAASSLSHVWLFATPWTALHKAPLSMGILQAKILEWVVMPSSRGSSWPKDWTWGLLYLLHWQEGSLPLDPPFLCLSYSHFLYLKSELCPTK